jgi:hypothetical protein
MANSSNRQIIDAWAQPVFKEGSLPEAVRLFELSGSAHLLGQDLSAAQLVEMMDEAGVDRVLLCAWHRPGSWIIRNDTIAEFVHQFPKRFIGVAAVNLEKPVEAVREFQRAVSDLGFKALRVVPWLWNRPPNDKLYFPRTTNCRGAHRVSLDGRNDWGGLEARERLHRHFCPCTTLLSSATGALSQNLWARQSALWHQLPTTVLGEVYPTGSGDELAS